ncbi:chemotaxis protein CheX [Salinispira pacifica]|uniref:Chemotaxis protein CheX n=1 Tax=Salinispira pacifica TaxID=1307761 RepID=V5WHK9_9SPIO|nr:chemotaxis protein CheX [Salinispira pacifica]AHC15100.1 Chemotaxis protein CheX [Salinispira pacifica]
MKAQIANPFITSAVKVFRKEIGVELTRKSLTKKTSPMPSLHISIIIGVTGPVRGQVVYSMDQSFAESVSKAMLPGKLPAEVRKMTHSAVSELANMITGMASIDLAGEDKLISITPPTVFTGPALRIDFLNLPTVSLNFLSQFGTMEVNIALADAG